MTFVVVRGDTAYSERVVSLRRLVVAERKEWRICGLGSIPKIQTVTEIELTVKNETTIVRLKLRVGFLADHLRIRED